jgi:hypothetical protein
MNANPTKLHPRKKLLSIERRLTHGDENDVADRKLEKGRS